MTSHFSSQFTKLISNKEDLSHLVKILRSIAPFLKNEWAYQELGKASEVDNEATALPKPKTIRLDEANSLTQELLSQFAIVNNMIDDQGVNIGGILKDVGMILGHVFDLSSLDIKKNENLITSILEKLTSTDFCSITTISPVEESTNNSVNELNCCDGAVEAIYKGIEVAVSCYQHPTNNFHPLSTQTLSKHYKSIIIQSLNAMLVDGICVIHDIISLASRCDGDVDEINDKLKTPSDILPIIISSFPSHDITSTTLSLTDRIPFSNANIGLLVLYVAYQRAIVGLINHFTSSWSKCDVSHHDSNQITIANLQTATFNHGLMNSCELDIVGYEEVIGKKVFPYYFDYPISTCSPPQHQYYNSLISNQIKPYQLSINDLNSNMIVSLLKKGIGVSSVVDVVTPRDNNNNGNNNNNNISSSESIINPTSYNILLTEIIPSIIETIIQYGASFSATVSSASDYGDNKTEKDKQNCNFLNNLTSILTTIKLGSFISTAIIHTLNLHLKGLVSNDVMGLLNTINNKDKQIILNTVMKFLQSSSMIIDQIITAQNRHQVPNQIAQDLHQEIHNYIPIMLINGIISSVLGINEHIVMINLLELIQSFTLLNNHQSFYYITLTFPYTTFAAMELSWCAKKGTKLTKLGFKMGLGKEFLFPNDTQLETIMSILYNLTLPDRNTHPAILYLMTKGHVVTIVQSITDVIYNAVVAWSGFYRAIESHVAQGKVIIEKFRTDLKTLAVLMTEKPSELLWNTVQEQYFVEEDGDSHYMTPLTRYFEEQLFNSTNEFLTKWTDITTSSHSQWRLNSRASLRQGYFEHPVEDEKDELAKKDPHSYQINQNHITAASSLRKSMLDRRLKEHKVEFKRVSDPDKYTVLSDRLRSLWNDDSWWLEKGEPFFVDTDTAALCKQFKGMLYDGFQIQYNTLKHKIKVNKAGIAVDDGKGNKKKQEKKEDEKNEDEKNEDPEKDGDEDDDADYDESTDAEAFDLMNQLIDALMDQIWEAIELLPEDIGDDLDSDYNTSIPDHLSMVPNLLSLLFNYFSSLSSLETSFKSPSVQATPYLYPALSLSLEGLYSNTLSKLLAIFPWSFQGDLLQSQYNNMIQLHPIAPAWDGSTKNYHATLYPWSSVPTTPITWENNEETCLPQVVKGVVQYLDTFKSLLCHSTSPSKGNNNNSEGGSGYHDMYFKEDNSLFDHSIPVVESTHQHQLFDSLPTGTLTTSYTIYIESLSRIIHGLANAGFYTPQTVDKLLKKRKPLENQWTYQQCFPVKGNNINPSNGNSTVKQPNNEHYLSQDGSLFQANRAYNELYPDGHNRAEDTLRVVDVEGNYYIDSSNESDYDDDTSDDDDDEDEDDDDDEDEDEEKAERAKLFKLKKRKQRCIDEYDIHLFQLKCFGLEKKQTLMKFFKKKDGSDEDDDEEDADEDDEKSEKEDSDEEADDHKSSSQLQTTDDNTDNLIPYAFDDITATLQHCIELFIDLLIDDSTWKEVQKVKLKAKKHHIGVAEIYQDDIITLQCSNFLFNHGLIDPNSTPSTESPMVFMSEFDQYSYTTKKQQCEFVDVVWDFQNFKAELSLLNLAHLTVAVPEEKWAEIFSFKNDHSEESLSPSRPVPNENGHYNRYEVYSYRQALLDVLKTTLRPAYGPITINHLDNTISLSPIIANKAHVDVVNDNKKQNHHLVPFQPMVPPDVATTECLGESVYLIQPSQAHLPFLDQPKHQLAIGNLMKIFSHHKIFPSTLHYNDENNKEISPLCNNSLNFFTEPQLSLDIIALNDTLTILSQGIITFNTNCGNNSVVVQSELQQKMNQALLESTKNDKKINNNTTNIDQTLALPVDKYRNYDPKTMNLYSHDFYNDLYVWCIENLKLMKKLDSHLDKNDLTNQLEEILRQDDDKWNTYLQSKSQKNDCKVQDDNITFLSATTHPIISVEMALFITSMMKK